MSKKRGRGDQKWTHRTRVLSGTPTQIGDTFAHIPIIHEAFPGSYIDHDVCIADVAMKNTVFHLVSTPMA